MTQAPPGSRNAQDGPWPTDKALWGLESAIPRESPVHTGGGHSTWSTVPAEMRGQWALRFQPRAKAQRPAGRLRQRPGSLQRQRVCPPGTFVQTLGSGTVRAYIEHSARAGAGLCPPPAQPGRVPQGPPVRDPEAVLTEHPAPGLAPGLGTTVLPRLAGTLETDETPSLPCADLTSRLHRPSRHSLVVIVQSLSHVREPREQYKKAERRSFTGAS